MRPPPEYDGGQPTNAPDLAGKPITVVDIPKLIGIGYFNATAKGMQEAAAELGNVTVINDGPTEANIDDQITFIDNYITQGVNGVLFAANDPVAIAPVLKKALEAGIHVVGYDANSQPDAREWFVNQAEFNGIAKALIDNLVAEKGDAASFGIVTSTFTTPNQARWIAEMWAYTGKCYPNLKWLETVEAQEDSKLSFDQATTLLNKYGDQIQGLFGMTSVATPNSADAVTQAGLCGKVAVVGLATPNPMKPFVESGCVQSVVLWNPVDLGYAAVYVLRAVVDGTFKPGDTSVEAGKLGTLQVVNGSEVLLGPPFTYSKDNINDFDF
jgi:ABC-type sugar transport system substrate-binding protein